MHNITEQGLLKSGRGYREEESKTRSQTEQRSKTRIAVRTRRKSTKDPHPVKLEVGGLLLELDRGWGISRPESSIFNSLL